MRTFARIALLQACAVSAIAQTTTPPQPKTFNSDRMGIKVVYPAILQHEDPGNLPHYSYRSVFALHPEADPDHTGLDPCAPLIIAFGTGPDKPLDPNAKIKSDKQIPLAPTGGITLTEITPKCMPDTSSQALANLAGGIQQIEGFKPLAKIVSYKVQDTDVFLATAWAFSKDEKGKRKASAGSTFLAEIATVVHGHILLWSVTTNNSDLYNQILKVHVCFIQAGCVSRQRFASTRSV